MSVFGRALRGLEAGALTAAAVAVVFLALDVVRLEPLATVGVLSGAAPGPGGPALDLTSVSGALAAASTAWHITAFTFGHFLAFAMAGVLASLLFDWKRFGGVGRFAALALLCIAAFYGTLTWSNPVASLEAVGPGTVIGTGVAAALLLAGGLFVAHIPEPEE